MAIVNNTYFRVLIDPSDSTGVAEISNADRVNIIGGGAVDEQAILLENSNHVYSTTNRRALLNLWSLGAPSSSATSLYENTSTALIVGLEMSATVGPDRQALTAYVHYKGSVKVEVLTPALVLLDDHTFTSSATATADSATLTWSTTTDIVIRIWLAGITSPSAADGFLWGVRLLENQTTI